MNNFKWVLFGVGLFIVGLVMMFSTNYTAHNHTYPVTATCIRTAQDDGENYVYFYMDDRRYSVTPESLLRCKENINGNPITVDVYKIGTVELWTLLIGTLLAVIGVIIPCFLPTSEKESNYF